MTGLQLGLRVRGLAAAALVALLVAACSTDGPAVSARQSRAAPDAQPTALSSLEWGDCDDPAVTEDELECAMLTVPLDYARPDGDTIDLALVRVPAIRSRDGAIFTNPGGPGSSGFDFVAYSGTVLRDEMGLDEFDIIGFDPRGVDRSGGLRCLTDAELDASMYLDYTPDSPEEEDLLDAAPADFATECIDEYDDTLVHYSTANTARDIDAIRAALGDDQISYLGISYGTYLGGVYATLFPDRVRAMVLDAAFDPIGDTVEEAYSTQLVGFENAFDNWAAWCQDTPAECSFSTDDVGAAWDELFDQLDAEPVEADDGRWANEAVMDTATTAALYSEYDWPLLGTALDQVRTGDPAALFRLADGYVGRADDGTYSTEQQSFSIISCASGFTSPTPDDAEALAEDLREKAPRFGGEITADDLSGDDGCSTLTPDAEAVEIVYTGDAPVVVVGGENDPATPIRWAKEMTASMGGNARLVTYTGEGHGFVLISRCVTEIEATVLVSLELPAEGTSCDPDPEIERPTWWDSLPLPDGVSPWRSDPAVLGALGIPPTFAYAQIAYTSLAAQATMDAFDAAMLDAGNDLLDRLQPFDEIDQSVYAVGDDVVSIIVIEPSDLDSPHLAGLAEVVAPGMTLIVQIYFPS
jgi:pimeloyl-ACP methyl ester carboxylesterase